MAPRSKRVIHIPNLDPKYVAIRAEGDPVGEAVCKNIDDLNAFIGNLPRIMPWNVLTVDQFQQQCARLSEPERLHLYWTDTLNQIQAYGLLTSWRIAELISSSIWAIRRDDIVCSAILARAGIETVADYLIFQARVRPLFDQWIADNAIPTGVQALEDELLKTLFASRQREEFYSPTNILTKIDNIVKKEPIHKLMKASYETLCEIAHPNFLGRSIYISEYAGRRVISGNHGPSARRIEGATLHALSWSASTICPAIWYMQDTSSKMRLHIDKLKAL